MDVKEGAGTAVQDSIVNAAFKYLGELPAASMLDTSSVATIDPFTRSGLTPAQLQDFFAAAAKAGRKTTPTTESGNVYAVSKTFHALNGPLVVDEYLGRLHSLDASDLQRARAFVETVALDAELRNRNPLHPVWKSKILRRVRAESSRRPPRHRRDACSMAWRCRFLAARQSQDGRVIAEK